MEPKRGWSCPSTKPSSWDSKAKVCPTDSGAEVPGQERRPWSSSSSSGAAGGGEGPRKMSCHEVGTAWQPRAGHRRSASLCASEFWRALERGGGGGEGQQRGKGPSGAGLAESIRRRCASFARPRAGEKAGTEAAGGGGVDGGRPAAKRQPECWKSLVLQKIQSFEQMVKQRCGGKGEQQQPGRPEPQAPQGPPSPGRWVDEPPGLTAPGAGDGRSSPEAGSRPRPPEGSPEAEAEAEPPPSPVPRSDDEASLSDESVLTVQSDVSQLDRSYSISLVELRECGLEPHDDLRRDERLDHSASLASNMSSMSVVSLIPADELDRLLEEVSCLEEETLQFPEEIQVVVLHKEEGAGLGFSIAGGADHENKMVTAHKVFPHGLAAQEGTIDQGDEILSINGYSLKGVTHSEALSHLHKARPQKQAIVVVRKVAKAEKAAIHKSSSANNMPQGGQVSESLGECITVELVKNSAGLGFSLDGGKGSSQGDRPLTIKKVFQGGVAELTGMIQPGDQLLWVNGEDCHNRTCYEAWNLIKSQPAGPVRLVIRKNRDGVTGEPV
ncbi:pro-interleukin-16-like [Pristis pectinata]|uniref:pro-interleukin-16-like n=1 Tax=Pristis pectinata TaxID=685728 RepID=UPI00223D73C1|nr:pro-interleukin-16-like [Pristis pectinata]XP_051901721.1 pro-interleukin-16-like [Pristis pectinata]